MLSNAILRLKAFRLSLLAVWRKKIQNSEGEEETRKIHELLLLLFLLWLHSYMIAAAKFVAALKKKRAFRLIK